MRFPIFITIFFCLFCTGGYAQMSNGLLGNEWVQYGQAYYKIKVAEDGMHRIPYQHLIQSGVNVTTINAGNVQIFHNGQEVPVYIHTNASNIEYIEFYAEKNRGELDQYLYGKQNQHFNPEYSLVSDTAAYFLTISNSANTARYTNTNAVLTNIPSREPYFLQRSVVLPGTTWQPGKVYYFAGEAMTKSAYEYGEGWGTAKALNQTVQVPTPYLYPSGPAAQLEARIYSDGNVAHNLQIRVGNLLSYNSIFSGDSVKTHAFSVAQNQMSNVTTVAINGASGSTDLHSVAYVAISYPHSFNFEGKQEYAFSIAASTQRKYLEIANFSNPNNSQNVYLYDITNKKRIHCYWDVAASKVLTDLPACTTDRKLVLICADNSNAYKTVGRLESLVFTDYRQYNGNYVIIAHDKMFLNSQGGNPVLEYAAYRASTGLNPVVLNAQEIFDQFGYGVNLHPQAMRNFGAFMMQNWSNPKYVFLIGKGRQYPEVRQYNTFDMLIPTFGAPASDNFLFASGDAIIPSLAVGRLSVLNGDELSSYLKKIKEMEQSRTSSTDPGTRGWEKNVIHMSSGINETEQRMFSTVLNTMKDTLETGSYGANVYSFFKKQSDPNAAGSSVQMDSLINSGVSLMTYLGHATTGSFDFNAYLLQNYNNRGRYPVFLSLSCSNGGIFNEAEEMSERFVLAPNSGAIAYIGFSYPIALSSANVFCNEFYRLLSDSTLNDGTAELLRKSLGKMEAGIQYNFLNEMAMNYAIYHGDPAYKMMNNTGADYVINTHNVKTEPALITAQTESFDFMFDLHNLGKAADASFSISLYRKFPDGDSSLIYKERVVAPRNITSYKIPVAVGGIRAAGVNFFTLKIDVDNEIAETPTSIAEQNNQIINLPIQVTYGQVQAIYPPNFAMLPDANISFLASPANIFSESINYRFDLDTTIHFNSPLFRTEDVNGTGGLLTWTPNNNFLDSVVYYWRVSPLSNQPNVANDVFSFMYKQGQSGWNQSHVYQFQSDKFKSMQVDTAAYVFKYNNSMQEVSVVNAFTPTVLTAGYVATFFNNVLSDKCRCQNENGVYVQVIDPSNFSTWVLPGGSQAYGATNCDPAGRPSYAYLFKTVLPNKQAALENFLRDSIPNGHYVLVYTLNNASAANWPNSLLSLFESAGATKVRDLASEAAGLPWAFFYQKGVNDYPHIAEALAATRNDIITISGLMTDTWYKGEVESTLIGPMENWSLLEWAKSTANNSYSVSNELDVYAVSPSGNSTRLMEHFTNVDTTIAMVDALEYPYMKLVWKNSDSLNRVAPQLKYWRVSADMPGELVFRPELYLEDYNVTVSKNDTLHFGIMIQNVSNKDMDSVLVKYQLQGGTAQYKRFAPLAAQDTMRLTDYAIAAHGLAGRQVLLIEINPNRDQLEATLSNNCILIPFDVKDQLVRTEVIRNFVAPEKVIFDMLFDGRNIQNGEVVPSDLSIDANITMFNAVHELRKIEDLVIKLRHPNMENGEMIIDYTNPLVKHLGFNAEKNGDTCYVGLNIKLALPWDELYEFELSCNSNIIPNYKIGFRVDGKDAGQLSNYPSPFSTHTQFSFIIDKHEADIQNVAIYVADINGNLVHIIDQNELGDFFLGVNKPAFSWDGTDAGGNQLSSGTYFCKLIGKMKDGSSKSLTKVHKIAIVR